LQQLAAATQRPQTVADATSPEFRVSTKGVHSNPLPIEKTMNLQITAVTELDGDSGRAQFVSFNFPNTLIWAIKSTARDAQAAILIVQTRSSRESPWDKVATWLSSPSDERAIGSLVRFGEADDQGFARPEPSEVRCCRMWTTSFAVLR
jgi:hypothetical protein